VNRLTVVVKQGVGEVRGSVVGIEADEIQASPFVQTAFLVEQHAEQVDGELIGAKIRRLRLEPRLLEPANLAQLALAAPAKVLLDTEPTAQIVILLDGLDIATRADHGSALFRWLCEGVLPKNVKLVITSRPTADADDLMAMRGREHVKVIKVDPADERVRADLVMYARQQLRGPDVERIVRARGMLLDQFHREVVARAAGNFLYLVSVARALRGATADGDDELASELLNLDGFPPGVEGLYAKFVTMARLDLRASGVSGKSQAPGNTTDWENLGQPLLGILTVARTPLHLEQLSAFAGVPNEREDIERVLGTLRWLLGQRGSRLSLFHESIAEFFVSDQTRQQFPNCHIDETTYHAKIVEYYHTGSVTWADVNWARADRYGLAHISYHLERERPRPAAELTELICPSLRRAIRAKFGGEQYFLQHIDRAAAHATRAGDPASGLAQVMYLGVARHQAARSSAVLAPKILGLLARVGRLEEALEHLDAIPPSLHKFEGTLQIWRYAHPAGDDPSRIELLERLVEVALTVPQHHARHPDKWSQSLRAIMVAARLLAAHDLDRALRLWAHGQHTVRGWDLHGEPPDPVYQSAAEVEPSVDKACDLISKMSGDRADAYLQLAARADSTEIRGVLHKAETSVKEREPYGRLAGLAHLAAIWASYDPTVSDRLLTELPSEVFRAAGDEKLARTRTQSLANERLNRFFAEAVNEASLTAGDEELAETLVQAAVELREVGPDTSRLLLSRLDLTVAHGHTESAFIKAIQLWTQWGEPSRARALAERLLAWGHSPRTKLEVAAALGKPDRRQELEEIERAYSQIPRPGSAPGSFQADRRQDELVDVARRFAELDTARAEQVAREIPQLQSNVPGRSPVLIDQDILPTMANPDWEPHRARDRYTVLAEIAHRRLDCGEPYTAVNSILDEALHSADLEPPLVNSPRPAPYVKISVPGPMPVRGRKPLEAVPGAVIFYNVTNEWSLRAEQHFYRNPADAIRALCLGPYTLARTIRVVTEQVADSNLPLACMVVRTISDAEERAIGLAQMHLAAHQPDHDRGAEALSRELDRTLAAIERYRWTFHDVPGAEDKAWTYLRPDHRVAFEVAVRALGCRPQDWEAVQSFAYLSHALATSQATWLSGLFATETIAKRPLDPTVAMSHAAILDGRWMQGQEDFLVDIARVAAAYQDFRISAAVPDYPSTAVQARIGRPIYSAAIDLLTSVPGPRLSPNFKKKMQTLVEEDATLPAVTGLIALAAEVRPECDDDIRDLSVLVIERARDQTPAARLDTLAQLAGLRGLVDLVDPVELLNEAEHCVLRHPHEHWVPDNVIARLFPVLITHHPDVALRTLYKAVSTRWEFAMSLLEHAARVIVDILGPTATTTLASAVRRGLACTSNDETVPDVVDGVDIGHLAQLRPNGVMEAQ
jgi:hypothetical protein